MGHATIVTRAGFRRSGLIWNQGAARVPQGNWAKSVFTLALVCWFSQPAFAAEAKFSNTDCLDCHLDPTTTRTIRTRDGVPVVTDGPFGEAKEQLAGVWAIDVESLDRAIELASPITDYDVVEIRGLMDLSGYEM